MSADQSGQPPEPPTAILPPDALLALRSALTESFTLAHVEAALGLAGRAALSRADLDGAELALDQSSRTAELIRLFILGQTLPAPVVADALRPLPLPAAIQAGLVEPLATDRVRAGLDLRPYGEEGGPDWWVVSDLGAEVARGPLAADHVLGIGAAATTLAQATIRRPVGRAADIGTGCGVQALHLARHADSVLATDISPRALQLAATTMAMSDQDWQLRKGSLLEPLAEQRFDLIVSNPPFIVGPGFGPDAGGFDYRDSGLAGDGVSRQLITGLPARLADGGTAQLLANWAITGDQDWAERLSSWLTGSECDAWIWQREVADPGEYISLWLRDAGERPGSPSWSAAYRRWREWFEQAGVLAIGMGLVNIRRTGAATGSVIVAEDVPQPVQPPIGSDIAGWFNRAAWLRTVGPDGVLAAALSRADDLVLDRRERPGPDGWATATLQVRQLAGMHWQLDTDDHVAAVLAGCTGSAPLVDVLALVADGIGASRADVQTALGPVITDLIQRGLLLPPGFDQPKIWAHDPLA